MKLKSILGAAAICAASTTITAPAHAGASDYLGEIIPVGYGFCPRGTAEADGSLISISSNSALFSLYGTIYGGDGRTTFALPDLRGRMPIGSGRGTGLGDIRQGEKGGTETNTLTPSQMPSHTHQAGIQTTNLPANSKNPRSDAFGIATANTYVDGAVPSGNYMNAATINVGNAGGSQAINNRSPFLVMRYCVNVVGIFPSRN